LGKRHSVDHYQKELSPVCAEPAGKKRSHLSVSDQSKPATHDHLKTGQRG
jgi:hypothetical protein